MINNSLLSTKKISAIYFTIDGNMTTQANTKTGDVMSWFVEGVPYSGNNTPAHTFLNVGGEGMIKSSDKFIGLTQLRLSACNITNINLDSLGGVRFPSTIFLDNNKISSVSIPSSANLVTELFFNANPELLSLDLSGLTGLGGNIQLNSCNKLATLTLPTSTQTITFFYAYSNPELLNLDASGLTGLGGRIQLNSCVKLTALSLPISNKTITVFHAHSNPELLILNMGGLTGLGGQIYAYSCNKLTSIELPVSNRTTSEVNIQSNPQLLSINASGMSGLGGYFRAHSCNKLVSISLPTSSQAFVGFHAYSNPELISLNLSGLTGLGGNIQLNSCNKLATLTLPTSTQTITFFYAYSNPELLSLNMSGLTGLGGSILLQNSAKLASVIFPASLTSFTRLECYQTMVTSWDLSSFTNTASAFVGKFTADGSTIVNTATASIILPTHATATVRLINFSYHTNIGYVDFKTLPNALNINLSEVNVKNCSWSAAIVNQTLYELNLGALSGFTGRTIQIGGNNADPDATSGGYDGLTAKANLEAKGITVNIV